MTAGAHSVALVRALQALSYPAVMALGIATFAGLRATGLPLSESGYLAAAIAAGLVTAHEIGLPHRREWRPHRGEVANDIAFLSVVQVLLPLVLSLSVVLWAAGALQSRGWIVVGFWPHELPIAFQAGLMLLAADFPRYWMHRAFHRFRWLWRLHAVHHSPHRLYWLNVGRFHPIEKAIQYAVDTLPFVLMGVPEGALALYFIFYSINGFFQHSNCLVRLGPLNYVVSGPELHRWHHSALPSESDTNFGNNLILWDVLFGTRFLPSDRSVRALGLTDRRYPVGFMSQLWSPFLRRSSGDNAL